MIRVVLLVGLVLIGSTAAGQEPPPFTMKFEQALQAYSKCLWETVERYDLKVTPDRQAAEGAVGACEPSYQAAEAQLADDFVTRLGYSQKSAQSAAARNMRSLKPMMTKAALKFAQDKRSGKNASN